MTPSRRSRRRRQRRLHRARRDAGHVRPPGRDGGGHVPPRPLRPHGRRHARRLRRQELRSTKPCATRPRQLIPPADIRRGGTSVFAPGSPSRRRTLRDALRFIVLLAVAPRACRGLHAPSSVRRHALGPLPLDDGRGTLRHRARPQRPPAARLHHAGRPLASAGRSRRTSTRATSPC